ncbi:hypothetical protein [Geodermatophilus sp. SYSU D01036]
MTGSATQELDAPAASGPPAGWAAGPLGEVQAADRAIARQTARRYRALAAFAATRPASVDRPQGSPGAVSAERWAARADVLRPVSEWAAQELSLALNVPVQRAEDDLERALTLTRRLPLVLDALESGTLHPGHLWCLIEHVAPIADDAVRTHVQGPRPRPALPLPRLPPPRPRKRRARPRPPLARGPDVGSGPGRLLHHAPPRQAPGARLDVPARPGRDPRRHDAVRPDRDDHPAALLSPTATQDLGVA